MPGTPTLRSTIALCSILLSSMLFTNAWASTSPELIEGSTQLNAEELIEFVEKKPELVIIDSRIPGDRKQGYIESSLSLPDMDTTCDSLAKVINNKNAPSLFYCNGVKCGRSAKAVKIALSCGYSNVYWFRGGFEEWLEKGYPYLQE